MVVDNHEEFLTLLLNLLTEESSLRVVGSARSGQEAVACVRQTQPDVVVMDLLAPKMEGIEATQQLKAHQSGPIVIFLTLEDDKEYQQAALAAGADGFLSKIGCEDTLVPLILHLCAASK